MMDLARTMAEMFKELGKYFYELVKNEMGYGTWLMLGIFGAYTFVKQLVEKDLPNSSLWVVYDLCMIKAMAALAVYTIKKEVFKK